MNSIQSADLASLNTMARAVSRDRQPLVLLVLSRIVAKVLGLAEYAAFMAANKRQSLPRRGSL